VCMCVSMSVSVNQSINQSIKIYIAPSHDPYSEAISTHAGQAEKKYCVRL